VFASSFYSYIGEVAYIFFGSAGVSEIVLLNLFDGEIISNLLGKGLSFIESSLSLRVFSSFLSVFLAWLV